MGNGGTLLDLGANIGEFAIKASSQFDKVIAVEAHPSTARIAERRTEKFPNIKVISAAVASKGHQHLFVSSPARSTSSSVRPYKRLKFIRNYYKPVMSVGVNKLIKKYKPRAIKMDIEGMEWECLEVMDFAPPLDCLLVEFHGTAARVKAIQAMLVANRINAAGLSMVLPKRLSLNAQGGIRGWNLMALFSRQTPIVHFADLFS